MDDRFFPPADSDVPVVDQTIPVGSADGVGLADSTPQDWDRATAAAVNRLAAYTSAEVVDLPDDEDLTADVDAAFEQDVQAEVELAFVAPGPDADLNGATVIAKDADWYVAGPMTGYDEYNFPAFRSAAAKLEEQGFVVIDPSRNEGGNADLPRSFYIELDVVHVLRTRRGVAVLPDWYKSRGARLEVEIARQTGREVVWADNLKPVSGSTLDRARLFPIPGYLGECYQTTKEGHA